jgi:hypothetical protein
VRLPKEREDRGLRVFPGTNAAKVAWEPEEYLRGKEFSRGCPI